MTTTERALTVSETAFILAGFGPVVVRTSFTGHFEPVVLESAWQRLSHEYPLLRCGILGGPDGFRLALRDSMPKVAKGADTFEYDIAQRHEDGAISRLSLYETADTTELTLAVDHAVSDGRLVHILTRTLLDIYGALLRGEVPRSAPRPVFEPGLEERFYGHYPHGWPEPAGVPGETMVLSGSAATPSSGFGVHHIEFDPGPTAEVVALARASRISVTDLLCGAVSTAVRARLRATSDPQPATLCIPVDLRERLVPPIEPDAQLCGALPCLVTVPVTTDDLPADVGSRVAESLRMALERDEPQRALLAQCVAPAPPPPMTFMVSNIGVAEDPVLPDGLRLTGSRVAATLHGPVPAMFAATVSGRLMLDVVYDRAFHDPVEIGAVVSSVEAALRSRVSS
ncbi:chromosome condensation protein [Amycolatopsis orientalis]|uniref:Phthiocerol/phthiodiolone dimycocerosyl transferase n=1 Tax=Amycolatopsis orientalis TaxID=31958 RepID=A0A193CAM9_AMYOR|nr:chromosome condensation protein [Amycolatopsis orientalis]ANN21676.1 chromosome condensation protein [Amycolatopsis orientalis]